MLPARCPNLGTLIFRSSLLLITFSISKPALASWDVFRIPQQGGTESIFDLNFINDQEGWFLIPGGGYEIHHTTNAAQNIVRISTGEADITEGFIGARSRIHFRDANLGYLLTNDLFDEFLYKTENGGETFDLIETPFESVYAMSLLDGDQQWIAGRRGPSGATSMVAFSSNGGTSWEARPTPLVGLDSLDMYFFDSTHGWVSCEGGAMMYTHDGGDSWGISRTGTSKEIKSIRFADPMKGWAVGAEGLILITKDGGKNWIHQTSPTIENLYDLDVVDSNRAFAVGGRIFSDDSRYEPSNVLFTEDGGANWFEESLPFTTNLRCMQILGNDIWIGGAGGTLKGDMYLFHRKLAGHNSPTIMLRPLPPGCRDVPYEDAPIEARFGTPPYTWTLSGGIGLFPPPGITINTQTGALEGTPTSFGNFKFRVNVADVNGATETAVFVLPVAFSPFTAGTDPLPLATHRKTYRAGIDFSGGNGPYDAQITSGELPPGLTLDPNLVLAGTPLETGEFDFALQVSDRSSPPQRVIFNLSIAVAPLAQPGWEVQHAHNRLMDIHFFDDKEGIALGWSGVLLRTLDGGRSWNPSPFGQTLVKSAWVGDEGWMIGENRVFHSIDRGVEWEELSHPLPYIEGVYFYDNQRGWIYGEGIAYTTNGGQSWDLANVPTANVIFSLDFADPNVGYAGSSGAIVLKSVNGGMNWSEALVQGLNDGSKSLAVGPPRPPSSPLSPSIASGKGPLLPQVGCVEFLDSQRGWIGTNQFDQPYTSLYRTDNGGESWTRQQVRGNGNVNNIQFLEDGLTGWTSMLFDTGFFYTTNGGSSWLETSFEGGNNDVSFWAQHFIDAGIGFVAYNALGDSEEVEPGVFRQDGLEGSLWKTYDGGRSFELVYGFPEEVNRIPNNRDVPSRSVGPDLNQIQFFDDLNGFAVGRSTDGGVTSPIRLYRTRNGGATWQFVSEPGVDYKILFTTPLHGWAIDQNSLSPILETRDGGETFAPREDITTEGTVLPPKSDLGKGIGQVEFSDLFFVDDQVGWIYVNRKQNTFFTSRLLRTLDGGATWQKIYEISNGTHREIYFLDRQNGYFFDEFGRIERSTDGGETWTPEFDPMQTFPYPRLNDLRFGAASQGWAVGNLGLVAHNVGESSWERVAFPETWTLFQTHFPLCSRGILVGAIDPVTGPPILIDQTDSVFSASETIDTGLEYHDLRAVDFSSTESGWAYGGFGAGMKYAAPTNAYRIVTDELPRAAINTNYSTQLVSANGTGSETWSLCSGSLPEGVSLNAAGLLNGTPTEAGEFRVQVAVADGSGQEAARWLNLSTQPEMRPTIITTNLPDGSVGSPYAAMPNAEGSIEPYDWIVVGGSLPPGLNLIRCGLIGGTPTTPGIYPFRVLVLDAQNPSGRDEKELTIEILGRFIDTNPGGDCTGNPLFCLAVNWKETSGASPSDFDGDGDADAEDVIDVLKTRRSQ